MIEGLNATMQKGSKDLPACRLSGLYGLRQSRKEGFFLARRSFGNKAFFLAGACLFFIGIFVILGCWPCYMLCIKDLSNGKTVVEVPTAPGDNLWIVFINSVEKLPVADHFVVNDNYQILFTETIFQAPYAGYDHSQRAELIAPGTLKISGYDRLMDAYTFYAGAIFRHMLFLNGNWLPLYEVAQGGDLIQITVKKITRLAYFINRVFSHE
jgi:hypothetical protein